MQFGQFAKTKLSVMHFILSKIPSELELLKFDEPSERGGFSDIRVQDIQEREQSWMVQVDHNVHVSSMTCWAKKNKLAQHIVNLSKCKRASNMSSHDTCSQQEQSKSCFMIEVYFHWHCCKQLVHASRLCIIELCHTWVVRRAFKKLELLYITPEAALPLLLCSSNVRHASKHSGASQRENQLLNYLHVHVDHYAI